MSAPDAPVTPPSGAPPSAAGSLPTPASERPEIVVAGAFVGGLLLATILRRLG